MKIEILNFILSMKWLWIIVIILLYRISIKIINIINQLLMRYITLKSDIIIRDNKYNEDEIIKHLDYIINESINEYQLLTLIPKNISYINTKEERKILNHLADEIPNRISKTLYTHLSFIYDSDYIGEFLGKYIHMKVTNFVLNFNLDNHSSQIEKK